MNGRVQDPFIGRFLSADPLVPDPLNGQSFNRFSYVRNNPLAYIDPSGFTEEPAEQCTFCVYQSTSPIFQPGMFGSLYGTGALSFVGSQYMNAEPGTAPQGFTEASESAGGPCVAGATPGINGQAGSPDCSGFEDSLYRECMLEAAAFPCELEASLREQVRNGEISREDAEQRLAEHSLEVLTTTGVFAGSMVASEVAAARFLFWLRAQRVARGAPALSREASRSIASLERRLAEHRAKLEAYKRNPDAFDNQGFLRNAPSQEVREQIIQGRIRHLEQEIRNFEQQIGRLLGGGS